MAKRRQLKGITRQDTGPKAHNYVMREKAGSPVQASMRTEDQPTYRRWSAFLDVPQGEKLVEYRLSVLATNVAADAAAAGAMGVAIRPQRTPVKAAQKRNTKEFHKLTAQLKDLDYGYCLDGGGSPGGCKVWYLKTVDTYGRPIHARSSSYKEEKPKKPKPVEAELGPAEDAFGPSTEPAAKPKKPKPAAKPKRPTKGSTVTISKEKREHVEAVKKANDSKGKRCKVLAKEKGYTISECNRGFTFNAYDKDDKEIGRLDLEATGGDEYKVAWSGTSEKTRGERVGTALYEAAAEAMCKRGWVLTSDTTRSRYSEKFWAKQESKGRATCAGGDDDDSMNREQAYDYVFENYLSEAESEYIENSNYEDEAAEAYFDENSNELSAAKSEYISNSNLEWEAINAYFESNPEERSEAISEYIDNHDDELELSEDDGSEAQYYSTPWEETKTAHRKKLSAARNEAERDKIEADFKRLDEKLPEEPYSGTWPCRKYRLNADVCKGSEIDLGKLPQGHVKRKGAKCPPGYRKHKAKNGMVSCRPVRRRKR